MPAVQPRKLRHGESRDGVASVTYTCIPAPSSAPLRNSVGCICPLDAIFKSEVSVNIIDSDWEEVSQYYMALKIPSYFSQAGGVCERVEVVVVVVGGRKQWTWSPYVHKCLKLKDVHRKI